MNRRLHGGFNSGHLRLNGREQGKLTFEVPDDVVVATGQSPEELVGEARLLLALKLFATGRASSSTAATICGTSRVEFLLAAGRAGIAVAELDGDELEREFAE